MITIRDLVALGVRLPERPRLATIRQGYLLPVGEEEFATGIVLPEKRAILIHRIGVAVVTQWAIDNVVSLGLFGPQDTIGTGDYDVITPSRSMGAAAGTNEVQSSVYDGGIFIADTDVSHTITAKGSFAAPAVAATPVWMNLEYFDLGAGGSLLLLQSDGLT